MRPEELPQVQLPSTSATVSVSVEVSQYGANTDGKEQGNYMGKGRLKRKPIQKPKPK